MKCCNLYAEIPRRQEPLYQQAGNPTDRNRSRHVDVKVHYLRDQVRDGHVKLVKCADTQNVSDALPLRT